MLFIALVANPFGVIRTPSTSSDRIPIKSSKSDVIAEAEILPEYSEELDSLDGFSHMILYWFHKAQSPRMKVIPFLDTQERELYATRAPFRPNLIGLSLVRVLQIKDNTVRFEKADMLNDTPLLDIKPFVPEFDNQLEATSGWLAESKQSKNHDHLGDSRFIK